MKGAAALSLCVLMTFQLFLHDSDFQKYFLAQDDYYRRRQPQSPSSSGPDSPFLLYGPHGYRTFPHSRCQVRSRKMLLNCTKKIVSEIIYHLFSARRRFQRPTSHLER